ncbi:MAG: lysylphosphatidylglycerol synthase transmembrane domain-containing protein [Sedimentisphaerales bacterium]|nr:lysylphosphatidylglycerol synthase transmembrane domain-containing protein [Sedimentisphaerales bacterium]
MSRAIRIILKVLVTVLLLAWVFRQIELSELRHALVQARWIYLLPIWPLAILSYWVLSFKLSLIMARQDCAVSTWRLFAISAVTTLYGMVLPGMLDLSAKWLMLRQQTGKGTNALTSMVYNQFTTTLVILIAGIAAILTVTPPQRIAIWISGTALIAFLITIGLLVLHGRLGPRLTRAFGLFLKPTPRVIKDHGTRILDQLAHFQTAGWAFHLTALGLSLLANTGIGTIIYWLAAKAAGISVPFGLYFWQCSAIFILGRMPISVAEFGIREATLVGSMAGYGVSASSAIVMSLVLFTNRLLLAAIGAVVQLYWACVGSTNRQRGSSYLGSDED